MNPTQQPGGQAQYPQQPQQPQYAAPPQPGQRPQPASATQRSTATKAVLITTAVVGGLALIGTAASAMLGLRFNGPISAYEDVTEVEPYPSETAGSTAWDIYDTSEGSEGTFTADASGITTLNVDLSFASLAVEYVEDAQDEEEWASLQVYSKGDSGTLADRWSLTLEGNELNIERAAEPGSTFMGRTKGDTAMLTLPHSLKAGIESGSIVVNAGEFTGTGRFNELDIELNAGTVNFNGAVSRLDAEANLGEVHLTVDGVTEAEVSANKSTGAVALTGTMPKRLDVEANMSELEVQLPAGGYRVETESALGDVTNDLKIDKGSPSLVRIEATASELRIR